MDKLRTFMPKSSLGLLLGVSLFPVLVSLIWLTGSTAHELNHRDFIYIFLSAVLLLAVEAAFVWIVFLITKRFAGSHWVGTGLAVSCALLGALNARYCLLILLDVSSLLRLVATLGIFISLIFILRFPASWLPSILFSSLLAAMPWVQRGFEIAMSSGASEHSLPYAGEKNVGQVKAPRGPIYLIGFDALISKAAFNRFMELPGEPVWNATLEDLGFNVSTDAIAAGNATRPSFNNLLNLGNGVDVENPGKFFSKIELNPAYRVFNEAGYQVQFLSSTSYFGTGIGKSIAHFYPSALSGFCDFIPQSFGILMCRKPVRKFLRNLMGEFSEPNALESHFLERIEITKNQPNWVTVAYLLSPGHTPSYGEYRFDDVVAKQKYISNFQVKSVEASAKINKIVSSILHLQPEAIIIVFGDHGAWMTRGAEVGKSPYTKEEIDLDQLGITFAVYPSDFCSRHFKKGYRVEKLVPNLMDCLSADN
jgi:hypothetical protein